MNQDKTPMYLLTYDHGGYILWGEHFKERLDSAIEWLQKYPSFKIGLDNEAFAYDQYAETQPEIITYLKEKLGEFAGRFAIGSSTYGQPLSVFINEESNVRQLTYAIRTNQNYFSQTPAVFAISEHGLHSQIPQLIRQAGYQGAVMRTHFMMYGYNPTYSAAYGMWRGEDGTEIPTVPTYDGEGADFAITTMDNWVLTRWPDQTDQSLEDFAAAFPDICPLLASRYDDIVLRCEKLTSHVEEHKTQYQWILLEEIPTLFGKPEALFAPKANEFVVRMPWGYCGNQIFNHCREGELSVLTAERLNASAVLAGGASHQKKLEESWKKLMVTQHHDIQICGLLDDEKSYIGQSLRLSREVAADSLAYLSRQFTTGENAAVMVYNPLSYPVRQQVEQQVSFPRGKGGNDFSLWFGDEEIPCEYEVLDNKEGRISRMNLRFTADVPSLSARCYTVQPHCGNASRKAAFSVLPTHTVQTPTYTLELDEGGIRSLKIGETVFFAQEKGVLFAGVIDGKEEASRGTWMVFQNGSKVQAEYRGFIGSVGILFHLDFTDGRIDCRVRFYHHGEKIGTAKIPETFQRNDNGFVHETKLRFVLPLAWDGRKASGVRDLPFLVEETGEKYIQGNYWTACSDGRLGLACFNKGAMCMVREESGISIPLEYTNSYVWGSRALYGEYSHAFSLLPFCGAWQENDLHRRALCYEYTLTTASVQPHQKGIWEKEVTFVSLEGSDNVLLSALYPEDGGVIARVYEYTGKEGTISLSSPLATPEAEVDLLGNTCGSYCEPFRVAPHKIHSFRLRGEEISHD